MIVEKINLRKESTSCNFCKKGELNTHQNGLIYPYEYVYRFKSGEGGGLLADICEECLAELKEKTRQL